MIYSFWDIEHDRLKLVILGHFWCFYPVLPPSPKLQKTKILKNEKNCGRYRQLTYVYRKLQSYDVWCLRCGVRQNLFSIRLARQNFLSFKAIFCPPLEDQENQNFQKLKKNTWRHYHFTHVHHIWQYDVWFPRYGAQQAEVFVFLDSFLPFYPLMDPENQNFEKMKEKKPMGILSFYTCAP